MLGAVGGTCASVRFDGAVISTRRPRLPNASQIASAFIKFIFPRAVWRSTQCVFDVLVGGYFFAFVGRRLLAAMRMLAVVGSGQKRLRSRCAYRICFRVAHAHVHPSNHVHDFDRVEAPAASPCLGFAHPGGDWEIHCSEKGAYSS